MYFNVRTNPRHASLNQKNASFFRKIHLPSNAKFPKLRLLSHVRGFPRTAKFLPATRINFQKWDKISRASEKKTCQKSKVKGKILIIAATTRRRRTIFAQGLLLTWTVKKSWFLCAFCVTEKKHVILHWRLCKFSFRFKLHNLHVILRNFFRMRNYSQIEVNFTLFSM